MLQIINGLLWVKAFTGSNKICAAWECHGIQPFLYSDLLFREKVISKDTMLYIMY